MRSRARSVWVVAAGAACVMGAVVFREPLRHWVAWRATLGNAAPVAETVAELIRDSGDPAASLAAAWQTGKIVHRQAAIRSFREVAPVGAALSGGQEALLLAAALDPDLSVREVAFGLLRERRHPALAALAAAQLRDPDPQVRWLGLSYLKGAEAKVGVPLVAELLGDAVVRVVGLGLKLLEGWSGRSFGARLSDTVTYDAVSRGDQVSRTGGVDRVRAAAEAARVWWARERAAYPRVDLEIPGVALAGQVPVQAADFVLPGLRGDEVRLSAFRGRPVLMNFWTTWCTACVVEMPELVELQRRQGDRLVILGISLDGVPDHHGQGGAGEEPGHGGHDHASRAGGAADLDRIRQKVGRVAESRGVNYRVLLDAANAVGGQYGGGELPTTVILDAEGRVRRRFMGARSLAVFEAMIAGVSVSPAGAEVVEGH